MLKSGEMQHDLSLKQIKSRKAPKGTTKGKGHRNTMGETTNLFALPLINQLIPKTIPQPDTSTSHPHYYKNMPRLAPLNPFKPIMSRPTKSLTTLIGQRRALHKMLFLLRFFVLFPGKISKNS